jgi:hypothetical protein
MRSCNSVELTSGFEPDGWPSSAWLFDDRRGICNAAALVTAAHRAHREEYTIFAAISLFKMDGGWKERLSMDESQSP